MKKKILSLSALLLFAVMVNAQVEVTPYRGAFAPQPVKMWTDNWVNWDPQNAAYGTPTVNKSGIITANETWTRNNVYLLQGVVYIDSLVTVTIEPGTVILGDNATANSSLLVQRGAKLIAEGTQCNPIVFTSSKAAGTRAVGDWGGIMILGRARHNLGTNNLIEGLSAANPRHYHGGLDDNDNSGSLKYVRIEYGGYVFAPNSEINGLTMGSVGRNTQIDYIQTSFINDDAFEFFGGAVSAKHLVAYRCLDDDFDTDNGWSGTVQFALSVKDPAISDNPAVSTSEGFESDNDPVGTNETLSPKTSGAFYNVTQIGGYRCGSNAAASGVGPTANGYRRALRLRRNTDLKIFNSIFMANHRGFHADGALALGNMDQDSLAFRNNIIAGDFTTSFVSASGNGAALAAQDQASRTRLFNPAYANDSVNTCSLLLNAWNFTSPDYRPNVGGDGAAVVANVSAGADLIASVDIDGTIFSPNQGQDFIVNVIEIGGGSTNGAMVVTISKLSGWDITVPGLTLSSVNQSGTNGNSNVFGGSPNNNGNWLFRQDANNIYATSKAGSILPLGGASAIGFTATRKATTGTGTSQSLSLSVSGGGDVTPANNSAVNTFGTSN